MKFTKLFFIAIGCFLLASCQESLEDKAAKECKEYTQKHCPTPVVSDTAWCTNPTHALFIIAIRS